MENFISNEASGIEYPTHENHTPPFWLPLADRKLFCAFETVFNADKNKYIKYPKATNGKVGIKKAEKDLLDTCANVDEILQGKGSNWKLGFGFLEPIEVEGKYLVCVDVDLDADACDDAVARTEKIKKALLKTGAYYEESVSGRGCHFFLLCDENQIPPTYSSNEGWKIEVFSGFKDHSKLVCLTGNNAQGKLVEVNLSLLFAQQGIGPIKEPVASKSTTINIDASQYYDRVDVASLNKLKADIHEVKKAISFIPSDDYDHWIKVGMALSNEYGPDGFKHWDYWSSSSDKYQPEEMNAKWSSFNGSGIGIGTLFMFAQSYGYKPSHQKNDAIDVFGPYLIDGADPETGEIIADSDEVNEAIEEEITLAPYPGIMADTVQRGLAAAFKPQHNLVMLSALIGMSAACHGKYRFADNTRLNLYGVGIAATGWGKDSPRQVAIGIAKAAGAKIIGKAASGEGLEDNLEDYRGMLSEVDEVAHLLEALNSKVKTPYLVTMALAFLALFSASAGTYHTRVKAKSKDNAEPKSVLHPCFSLFGFCTPEKLGQALTISNAEDGLMGRILFMNGVDAAPVRYTQPFILPPNAIAYANAIKAAFSFNGELTTIEVEANADDLLWEITQEYDHNRKQAGSPIELQVLIRSAEKLKRIAGVLAVWDNPSKPVIKLAHVHWGGEFVKLSNKAVLHFIDNHMASEEQISDANALLGLIKKILANKYKACNANELAIIKAKLVPHSMALRLFKMEPTA